jgi:hypothetical protein
MLLYVFEQLEELFGKCVWETVRHGIQLRGYVKGKEAKIFMQYEDQWQFIHGACCDHMEPREHILMWAAETVLPTGHTESQYEILYLTRKLERLVQRQVNFFADFNQEFESGDPIHNIILQLFELEHLNIKLREIAGQ